MRTKKQRMPGDTRFHPGIRSFPRKVNDCSKVLVGRIAAELTRLGAADKSRGDKNKNPTGCRFRSGENKRQYYFFSSFFGLHFSHVLPSFLAAAQHLCVQSLFSALAFSQQVFSPALTGPASNASTKAAPVRNLSSFMLNLLLVLLRSKKTRQTFPGCSVPAIYDLSARCQVRCGRVFTRLIFAGDYDASDVVLRPVTRRRDSTSGKSPDARRSIRRGYAGNSASFVTNSCIASPRQRAAQNGCHRNTVSYCDDT